MEDLLGAQPADVIRDAVEEVISILKDEQLRDPERHYDISKLLTGKNPGVTGGLSSQRYAQFVGWSKKMTDYHRTDDTTAAATTTTKQEDEPEMNEEMGVAVVFDESEEERSGDEDVSDVGDEVVDVMSSSDEEDEQQYKNKNELLPQAEGMEDVVALTKEQQDVEETKGKRSSKNSNNIQQQQQRRRGLGESTILEEDDDTRGFVSGKKGMGNGTTDLTVHDIDAHWLQRQLSATKFSDDVNICAKVADDILNILEVPDTRECENKLLLLLGFDLFEFIKLLLSQRLLIWACIKLKRARDEQEKQSIEDIVKRSDPDVWDQLYSKESVENWTQDRMTRAAKETKKEAQQLNVGAADTSISSSLKEDEVEGDWVKQQQKQQKGFAPSELDLDSLAFHEGGHLMSNKKCDLPEGSWRAMKKGYEEVHVPAIRSIVPKDERLIEITDLPPWTHAAFEGMEKLNRVQSKMYEAALYTSENLLLCAPTGAGK
jgi:pre-mRNA-splicing helicase BRR2